MEMSPRLLYQFHKPLELSIFCDTQDLVWLGPLDPRHSGPGYDVPCLAELVLISFDGMATNLSRQ